MRIYAGIPAFVLMLMLQLPAGSAESAAADNRRLFCGSRMMGIFGQNEQQPPEEKR